MAIDSFEQVSKAIEWMKNNGKTSIEIQNQIFNYENFNVFELKALLKILRKNYNLYYDEIIKIQKRIINLEWK